MRRFLLFALFCLPVGCSETAHPLAIPGQDSASHAANGSVRIFFTQPGRSPNEPDNIARQLAGYIDKATNTIDVCAFELDNKIITDALVRAVGRGVRVRLACETDYLDEVGVHALKKAGVPVIDDKRSPLMHNKFMVFDSKAVWTGSMNFTENCAYKNNNNGIYIDDARIAANYATKFSWMFDQQKFGGAPSKTAKIPNQTVTLADGTVVENYFSTHDKVANHVIDQIKTSKSTIHFMAFSFTHKGIAEAMIQRNAAGVKVRGVFEKSQSSSSYSEFHHLRTLPGFDVVVDGNPRNMHHKVIIIDGETTVAGSFNFSDGADKQNDENVVIFRSKAIADQFEAEFQRVMTTARQAGGR